jgi:putative transposon-encoded protein
MGNETNNEQNEFEKEVKPFGNGGHVTLPKEYIGETVVVKQISDDGAIPQPPVTKEDIKTVLESATREDFDFQTFEADSYLREGVLQYENDVRLSVDVEFVREGDGNNIHSKEEGRVVHHLEKPSSEELLNHTNWWTEDDHQEFDSETEMGSKDHPFRSVLCLDPDATDIIGVPYPRNGDVYRYSIEWNDSVIASAMFEHRSGKSDMFYVPFWKKYESKEDFQSSIWYSLATAVTGAPDEYDAYLELMTQRGIGWSEGKDPEATADITRKEMLEEAIIFDPRENLAFQRTPV